ncbi:MAG: hypothetical protein P8X88_05695, partial [Gammaproteobacteria bacterium]
LNKDRVIEKGMPLSYLMKDNKNKVEKFLRKYNGKESNYLYLPMVGKNNDLALVISKATGMPVDGISVDPWI